MAVAESQTSVSAALKLVEIENKGRGYVAAGPLKGGQVVLREAPLLVFSAYPLKPRDDGSFYSRYCVHCYRCLDIVGGSGDMTTFTCPSCCHPGDGIFCSAKCLSSALSMTHTPWVCQALTYLRNCSLLLDHQPAERQVQARYLVAAYNLAMTSPSTFNTLLSLHGDGERYLDIATFFNSTFSSLSFPEGFPAMSVETIAAILDKETNNSFNLMEPAMEKRERSVRAYAIYSNVSFFNHDCLPNACRFENLDSGNDGNTDLIIRMVHDVPEGTEICLSYVRVNRNYSDRKERLLGYFGFACCCNRCKVEASTSEDCENMSETMLENEKMSGNWKNKQEIGDYSSVAYFLETFVCDKENCGGTLAPLPSSSGNTLMECNYCGYLKEHRE